MRETDGRERTRRRQRARLKALRGRIAVVSTVGFAALFGLAAQHHVGSTKRRPTGSLRAARAVTPVRFFDQADDGYAFDDGAAAAAAAATSPSGSTQAAPPPAPPPPVAQTSVS